MSRVSRALPILMAALGVGAAGPIAPPAASALSFQPQLGLPAESVNMVGVAPGEEPGQAVYWATGGIGATPAAVGGLELEEATVLLRRSGEAGWQIVPVLDGEGDSLSFTGAPAVSYDGAMVLLSADAAHHQTILARDARSPFEPAPAPPSEGSGAVLDKGETLYPNGVGGTPIFTAIDESPQHVGALVVPSGLSAEDPGVLRYDSEQQAWTREPICAGTEHSGGLCAKSASGLTPLAIAASSPQNAWLLATTSSEELKLFKREAGSPTPVWVESQPANLTPWASPADKDEVLPRSGGQMLTVTSRGVWVDAAINTPTAHRADISLLLSASAPSALEGTWCYPQSVCDQGSLGAPLPAEYRSFAWAEPGAAGTRLIVGLEDGAMLRSEGGGDFKYITGGGGSASSDAEFAAPEEGWISAVAASGANSAQLEHVTPADAAASTSEAELCAAHQLCAWPLPFRRPLLAIAPQPGTAPGDPNAQALAVGDQGQIARYVPGEGWSPEFLYKASGEVATPRLRGVAWPEPDRAYAVGDEGAMWLWRAETGLWEPDAAAPLGLHANLTAIAFSPVDPAIGYAVGKQGTLLAYDKTWTQQKLPAGLESADFTSVAFAGSQALATYRIINSAGEEEGGLLINDGGEWEVDSSAKALLAGLGKPGASVLSKVAGLPDGGAVAAGPGLVIERDNANAPWRFSPQPLPEAQNIAALAAIRAGSEVRALVSVDLDALSNPNSATRVFLEIDDPQPPGFDEPPALIEPDPLPISGYLLRQGASGGWEDLEQQAYPNLQSATSTDLPDWPDAVLALDVSASGAEGWAVGGQTSGLIEKSKLQGFRLESQSAATLRLGGGAQPPQSATAPIPIPAGEATFALGGNAQCAGPCADLFNERVGPDAWLSGAISRAAKISGLRAFLYSGARVAEGAGQTLGAEAFARELKAYHGDLEGAGALPVRVAASPSDVAGAGGLASFTTELGADAPIGTTLSGTNPPPAGTAAYAFESQGNGGPVSVIVLDYSASKLAPGELGWLAEELQGARRLAQPAVVLGNADIVDSGVPNRAADGAAVQRVLLEDGASAYLFDSEHENLSEQIGSGAAAIPALGSGTLGYVPSPATPAEFLGASGFLLVSVNAAARDPRSNRAPVSATLVPNISQLALDATDGTLLRRSQVALFQGLARRPAGGLELAGGTAVSPGAVLAPNPYVPIPELCSGSDCSKFVQPAYTFSSSRPDIGNFVEPEVNNGSNPRAVHQGPGSKPIPDPQSGLFCAFNQGTTTVTITTGGLSYSEPVTVQGGSVEQPCGTVPLVNPPAAEVKASAPVAALPPSAPPASSPAPLSVVPPAPPAAVLVPPVLPAPLIRPPAPPPLLFKPLVAVPALAVVLPPPPVLARPIPPSGTAPVTVVSPAVAPEEKREDEEAIESARNSMAIYEPGNPHLPPTAPLVLIVLAAGAGATIRRAGGRARRPRRVAPALVPAQRVRRRQ